MISANTPFIVFFLIFFPEIIKISSSEDSSSDSHPMSWADYFPKDYQPKQLAKIGSSSNKVDSSNSLTSKQLAKIAFDDRIKVLGMPNKANCELIGIKPFAGKGKKKMV